MPAIIDTRQSFLDESGAPIQHGRLVAYKLHTLELSDIFSDADQALPLPNPMSLSSAGWTSTQVYSSESVTVEVQALIGLDENGQELYSLVKTFDALSDTASGAISGGGLTAVGTIPELRALSEMSPDSLVTVAGYNTPGDCYARTYRWSATSAATDDGGYALTSNVEPTGRWVLQVEGGRLDIRAFGVLAGADNVNSQFRAACNFAADAGVTLVIPAGTYNFASSGTFDSYCAFDIAPGVKLQRGSGSTEDPASWYVLHLWNPGSEFRDTLAGTGFKVILEGPGWEETTHPLTLWDPTAKGYAEGTATFGLLLTDTEPVSIDTDRSYSRLVLHAMAIPVTIKADSEVHIDHIEGPGSITWLGAVPYLREARRSHCNTLASTAAARCSELFIVDKALTLASSTVINCLVQVLPPATLSVNSNCTLARGVLGYPGCITGSSGFASDAEVDINLYTNPNAAMDSWNRSTASNALDLKSRTVTIAPAKNGRISNGVIHADVTAELILDNVEFVGSYDGPTIRATNCRFEHPTTKPIGAGTHSTLTDCTIKTIYAQIIDPDVLARWTRVAVSGRVVKKGNGGVWRDVSLSQRVTFAPDADGQLGNFSWVGGSATSIELDPSYRPAEGACIIFNFEVRGLIGLAYGIKAHELNSTSRYWAPEGHYNVRIGDNEAGPATYGTAVGTQISGGDSLVTIEGSPSQILWLTASHTSDQVRALGRVTNINAISPAYGPPAWSGEGGFVSYPPGVPSIRGSRTRGEVGNDSRCTYNFEVYHRTLS